jgi:hypothetical protein
MASPNPSGGGGQENRRTTRKSRFDREDIENEFKKERKEQKQ